MAVRLMRAFQRSNRSMYVDMFSRSLAVSGWSLAEPTKGFSNSAMRAVFIRTEIVDGGEEILNRRVRGGFAEDAEVVLWGSCGKGRGEVEFFAFKPKNGSGGPPFD